jgi:hypothetical protein
VHTLQRISKYNLLESIVSLIRLPNIYIHLEEICKFINNDKTNTSLIILSLFEPEIPQYIKDWFNINKQNGIIYKLTGGNIGLLLKDAPNMLTSTNNRYNNTYIYEFQNYLVYQTYTIDPNPYYKISKIPLTGKNLLENYQCSIFNKIQPQSKKVLLMRNHNSSHVSAFFKFNTAIIFYFSSNIIQITYNSNYIVLLSNKSQVFNLVYPSGLITTFKTIEIESYQVGLIKYKKPYKADCSVVYLQLTKDILQKTVEYINNNTGTGN